MPIADSAIKELISKGILKVEPYDPKYVDSCSITLHLAPVIVTDKQPDNLDLHLFFSDENYVKNRLEKLARMDISREKPFHLEPGQTCYSCTAERVTVPDSLLGIVSHKWALTQFGLMVSSQSGLIQPSSGEAVKLSLSNLSPRTIALYPYVPICQVVFEEVKGSVERPYSIQGGRSWTPYQ